MIRAVLETQRILGGDSRCFYLGSYEVEKDRITATVTITHFNGASGSVFGMPLRGSLKVCLEGRREGNEVHGRVWPEAVPGMRLPAMLRRLADLPP